MAVVPRKVEISCVGLSDVRDKEGMNLSGDSERPYDDHDKMLSQLTTKYYIQFLDHYSGHNVMIGRMGYLYQTET